MLLYLYVCVLYVPYISYIHTICMYHIRYMHLLGIYYMYLLPRILGIFPSLFLANVVIQTLKWFKRKDGPVIRIWEKGWSFCSITFSLLAWGQSLGLSMLLLSSVKWGYYFPSSQGHVKDKIHLTVHCSRIIVVAAFYIPKINSINNYVGQGLWFICVFLLAEEQVLNHYLIQVFSFPP